MERLKNIFKKVAIALILNYDKGDRFFSFFKTRPLPGPL